jgi:hypothetical protein
MTLVTGSSETVFVTTAMALTGMGMASEPLEIALVDEWVTSVTVST